MQEGQGRRRPCHWTIYIHRCMEPVVLDTSPKSKNVEITINLKTQPWPMKCYRNYLINCRGLAKYPFRFHGKHQMESLVKKRNLSFWVIRTVTCCHCVRDNYQIQAASTWFTYITHMSYTVYKGSDQNCS